MNFDGLKDAIIELVSGVRKKINTQTFTNDMTTFSSADDVLTLLIIIVPEFITQFFGSYLQERDMQILYFYQEGIIRINRP